MHISWCIHVSNISERPFRPNPQLKGLSSKAREKITLRLFSRVAVPLKATRHQHVPQAHVEIFRSKWPQHESPALDPLRYYTSDLWCSLDAQQVYASCSVSQESRWSILQNETAGEVYADPIVSSRTWKWWNKEGHRNTNALVDDEDRILQRIHVHDVQQNKFWNTSSRKVLESESAASYFYHNYLI